jgi:hypothetical protein
MPFALARCSPSAAARPRVGWRFVPLVLACGGGIVVCCSPCLFACRIARVGGLAVLSGASGAGGGVGLRCWVRVWAVVDGAEAACPVWVVPALSSTDPLFVAVCALCCGHKNLEEC